jgi:hypothetical protein
MASVHFGAPVSMTWLSGGTATLKWDGDFAEWQENPLIAWVRIVEPKKPAEQPAQQGEGA